MKTVALLVLGLCLVLVSESFAYFTVTHLTTVVYLSNSTSAQVEETLQIYMSNSSIQNYMQDRAAVNQTITIWQKLLQTNLLEQHIINPRSSISNFTLLPGPATPEGYSGATAYLTMMYVAHNVTQVSEIAPRVFKYTFNDSCFNFEHTASGPALFQNATLEMVLPKNAKVILPIYPAPDSPIANYANATQFYWFQAEPLNKFQLSYTVTESLQQEVVSFFANMYPKHAVILYLLIAFVAAGIAAYAYSRIKNK